MTDRDERVLSILMAQVGRDDRGRPRLSGLFTDRRQHTRIGASLLKTWAFIVIWSRRCYYCVVWHMWLKRNVLRGRERWRKLAGIGERDNYETFHRAQKIGYIHVQGRPNKK